MATNNDDLGRILGLLDAPAPRPEGPLPAETGNVEPQAMPRAVPAPSPSLLGDIQDLESSGVLNTLEAEDQSPLSTTSLLGQSTTEFGRGLQRGAAQVVASVPLVGAALSDIFGAEETTLELAQIGQGINARAREEAPQAVPFEVVFGPEGDFTAGNFIRWLASATGEQVPVIASVMASGGVGGGLVKLTQRGLSRQAANAAARGILKKQIARGVTGGAFLGATALETGGIVEEQAQATGEINGAVALVAGGAAGALESLTPLVLARATGLTAGLSSSFLNKAIESVNRVAQTRGGQVAAFVAGGSFIEATTELAQEAIAVAARDFVDENFSVLDPKRREEIRLRLLESAVTGLFIGGGVSVPVAILSRGRDASSLPDPEKMLTMLKQEQEDLEKIGLSQAFAVGQVDPLAEDQTVAEPSSLTFLSEEEGGESVKLTKFERAGDFVDRVTRESEDAGVALPVDVNDATKFRLLLPRINPNQLTASIRDIPADIDFTSDSRVKFLEPEREVAAASAAAQAIEAFQTGNVFEAEATYNEAIRQGLRVRPLSDQSFIVVGEIPQSALRTEQGPIDVPEGIFRNNTVTREAVELSRRGGESFTVLSVPVTDRSRTEGVFSVDLRRIPDEQLSNVIPADIESELESQGIDVTSFTPSELESAAIANIPGLRRSDSFASGLAGFSPDFTGDIIILGPVPQEALSRIPWAPGWSERAHVALTEKVNETIDEIALATGHSFDEQKTGTAVVRKAPGKFTSVKTLTQFRKIAELYTELMKQFNITDRKIVILPGGFEDEKFAAGGASPRAGWQLSQTGQEQIVIAITGDANITEVDRVGIAMHEFGHFLMASEWGRLDAGMQRLVLSAYDRSLLKAVLGRGDEDFQFEFFSASRADEKIWPTFIDRFGQPAGIRNTKFGRVGDIEFGESYFLNFDEWFADQMARWSQTRTGAIGIVERFFSGVGAKFKKIVEAFQKKFPGLREGVFDPQAEFDALIDYLQGRDPDTIATASQLGQAHDTANIESELASQKIFNANGMEGTEAVPQQAATFEVKAALTKLGGVPNSDLFAATSDRFNKFMSIAYSVQQIARLNPQIKGLQIYKELVDRWAFEKRQMYAMADETVRTWDDLGAEQAGALGDMLFAMDSLEYLSNAEVEAEVQRLPTLKEEQNFAQKLGLQTEGFEMYERVKKQFSDMLDELEESTVQDVVQQMREKAARDPDGIGVILDDTIQIERGRIKKEFDLLRKTPYFPHMRFGNFGVSVRNPDGEVQAFWQFDTKKAADAHARQMQRTQFPTEGGFSIRVGKIPEVAKPLAGMPPAVLRALADKLKLSQEQRDTLDSYIAEHLPARSFAKRRLRRKNVAGFSQDAMRNYAAYFFHGANYLARLKWGGQMQDSIEFMKAEKDNLTGQLQEDGSIADTVKRDNMIEMVQDHLNNLMNPQPDWAELRSFAFLFHLGFNAKSAFVNLTQVPMVTWPYLSARFGNLKALNAIQRAGTDFGRTWARRRGETETRSDIFYEALNLGMDQGFLDESMAKELAEVAEATNMKRILPGTNSGRLVREINFFSAWMFQNAEKINRSVTFRAGWDLAQANPDAKYLDELMETNPLQVEELLDIGWETKDIRAYLAGRDAVVTTQFNYQTEARPRFMRGRKASILTFFMFKQNLLFFAAHMPGRTKFLLMMFFFAGLMGLPGAEDINAIVRAIARQTFGKDFDLERETRAFVLQILGEDPAVPPDLFIHGISRYGFGLPAIANWILGSDQDIVPSTDLSGSIGFGQVIPGLEPTVKAVTGTSGPGGFDRDLAQATQQVAGAGLGIPLNLLRAMTDGQLPVDDFKRWERAMPSAIRSVMRATRFAREERERTRTGATVVEFPTSDPHTLMELAGVALGFQPTRLSQKWSREIAKAEVQNFWGMRRGVLLRQFDQATSIAPGKGRAEMIKAIKRFNREVPFPSIRISSDNLRDSVRSKTRARKLFEAGIGGSGKREVPLAEEINRLFPEVPEIAEEREGVIDVQDLRRQ